MNNTINYSDIGKKIKTARQQKKISQEKLASKCNISSSYLSLIESGSRNIPLDVFIVICNELSLSPDYLLKDIVHINDDILIGVINHVKKYGNDTYKKYFNIIAALAEVADKL